MQEQTEVERNKQGRKQRQGWEGDNTQKQRLRDSLTEFLITPISLR